MVVAPAHQLREGRAGGMRVGEVPPEEDAALGQGIQRGRDPSGVAHHTQAIRTCGVEEDEDDVRSIVRVDAVADDDQHECERA